MAGGRFGRYELLDLIGQGGMGQVYRARDTLTERTVAVKVLHQGSADQVTQERFRREAKAAAALGSPHVVPIFDYGDIDGRLFIAMQLLEGEGLDALLARTGPLPAEHAVRVIAQAAEALHAAHAAGLVHRDVKPSNLFVTPRGFVYLIDFGIARAAGESGLTSVGGAIGTLAYMAPERFSSGAADARSDVYALACVLFELLTGRTPFQGPMEQQIAGHLSLNPPYPSTIRPELGTRFDAVIAYGMAKDPQARFRTARDLAAACHGMPAGLPPLPSGPSNPAVQQDAAASPARRRRRWPIVAGALTAVVALAAATVGYLAQRPAHSAPPLPAQTNFAVDFPFAIGAQPDAVAVDQPTRAVYFANAGDGTVTVIDSVDHKVVNTLTVGKSPSGVVVDSPGHTAYVTNGGDGTVSVIDTISRTVTATIPAGGSPIGIALDADRHALYVANSDAQTVTVIDSKTHALVRTIPIESKATPLGIAIDPSAHTVYVANKEGKDLTIIDAVSNVVVGALTVGDQPRSLAIDGATHTAYVANMSQNLVSVVDLSSRKVTATVPVGSAPFGVAVDPEFRTVYVADANDMSVTTLDTVTRKVTATLSLSGVEPMAVAVDPGTHSAFVADVKSGVSIIRPQ
ncbi:serine/threonine-protein kinase [Nocardia stercoris]|uniref:non-specific serine/threonine protein kinase n=1 Tax=Nocardia stercoris TaxID=2483361 RepID=A0A3M2LC81_9NOCA|nr:serine/threonine-protein kinase [Nocardia stercoris]RMI35159.1 hypothetical protein EBN03_02320 [Nocardia stercoris]